MIDKIAACVAEALSGMRPINEDPLTGRHRPNEPYEALFHRIVYDAPAPIGLRA